MGMQAFIIIWAIAAALIGTVVWGALMKTRSIVAGVMALAVFVLAITGGWHAWMEGQSIPWMVGYGTLAVFSSLVAVRHLLVKSNVL